mmetsp:Transcript_31179/g.79046  ORF Transcript_31179/g.79046 Transcript_31179/m.79046 type:complete len:200 (+) Transcript_31179:733-1332(+)
MSSGESGPAPSPPARAANVAASSEREAPASAEDTTPSASASASMVRWEPMYMESASMPAGSSKTLSRESCPLWLMSQAVPVTEKPEAATDAINTGKAAASAAVTLPSRSVSRREWRRTPRVMREPKQSPPSRWHASLKHEESHAPSPTRALRHPGAQKGAVSPPPHLAAHPGSAGALALVAQSHAAQCTATHWAPVTLS